MPAPNEMLMGAFHEAGHAVVAVLKGVRFEHVSATACELKLVPVDTEELLATFDVRRLVHAAGTAAEVLAVERCEMDALERVRAALKCSIADGHDIEVLQHELGRLGRPDDPNTLARVFEEAESQARILLMVPAVWRAVEAVKTALLEGSLTEADVRATPAVIEALR